MHLPMLILQDDAVVVGMVDCCYYNNRIFVPLSLLANADWMLIRCSWHCSQLIVAIKIKEFCCYCHRLHALTSTDTEMMLLLSPTVGCCYYNNRIFSALSLLACTCQG